MQSLHKIIILICLALISEQSFAQPGLDVAKKIASQFIQNQAYHHNIQINSENITDSFQIERNGIARIWIINIDYQAYVVIPMSYKLLPVLAFSTESKFENENIPASVNYWIQKYAYQVEIFENSTLPATENIKKAWENFTSHTKPDLTKGNTKSLSPLLYTKWNQGLYYNEDCPYASGGPGGKAYAGCVPTAIAQVMNYFRWPQTGNGSYSYYDTLYGTLSANYAQTFYNWDEMPLSLSRSNLPLAGLLFDIGVGCDLHYGGNGSGMTNHKAAYAMKNYFKYDQNTQYLFRDSTQLNWKQIMLQHLDQKIPMYYAGWESPSTVGISGHAFVLDGYQDTGFFHFNFGWGGSYDGYFNIDNLVPGGSVFNYGQELVINAFPDTLQYQYPYFCSGTDTLKTNDGTIEDGSGPLKNYQNNQICKWLIAPNDSISSITLNFKYIKTEANSDFLTIYDGNSIASVILAKYSGDTLPGSLIVNSSKVLVIFSSDNVNTANGFLMTYTSTSKVFCSTTTTLTAASGVISDGSGNFDYRGNANCRWIIQPANAGSVTAIVLNMNTEEGKDLVRIYDNVTNTLVSTLSGDSIPLPITINSGIMKILFTSNPMTNDKGWKIIYSSSTVGMEKINPVQSLLIYPNPCSDNINLFFEGFEEHYADVFISNVEGAVVYKEKIKIEIGKNSKTLPLTGLTQGLYFIQIQSDKQIIRNKIVLK